MKPAHLAFMLLITFLWGFNLVSAKVGVDGFGPLLFTLLRFSLLTIVLAPFLRVRRDRIRALIGVSLTAGGLHFALVFGGLSLAEDITSVAIAIQLSAPFATVLSVVFLRERVGWLRACGVALAFGGVLMIGFDPRVFDYVDGVALVVAGAFVGAVSMLLMKGLRDVGVFELQAWVAALSLPVLVPLSLLFDSDQWSKMLDASWVEWGTVAYTALCASLIGHGGFYYLLQRYELSLLAPLTLIATPIAVVFGVTLLGDQLTVRMVVGGAVTLAGVLLVTVRQPPQARAVPGAR